MTYSIEQTRNPNLEDTAVPNLFITDFMPDVPDSDYVKVYIYAYMSCRGGVALTHAELADRLSLDLSKVIGAWKYYSERRIVRLTGLTDDNETRFDVEFVDVKGVLYGGDKASGKARERAARKLDSPELAELFQKISVICGNASLDGGDAQRIVAWIEEDGATPEVIEAAYKFCREERGEVGSKYIGKIVLEWTEKGLKAAADVREYRARTDARSAVHKTLMEAVGLRYSVITAAEEKMFNRRIDDFDYTPEQIIKIAETKCAGIGNKLKYLDGIIKKEMEAAGKPVDGAGGRGKKSGLASRNDYYQKTRYKNEAAAAKRQSEVYASIPAIKQADDEVISLNNELIRILTSKMKDKKNAVNRLNTEIENMVSRRKELLEAAGFASDYLDIHYTCSRCNDRGILENGVACDCFSL